RSRVFNLKFDQPVVSTGSKTAYQKTPIHDEVKNEHEINYPASLFHSRQAEVDVAATMLSKYDSDVVEEPEGYSEVSIEYSNYLATRLDMKKELLSYQDCIEGIPGMDGLDMKTSAGLPYTLMHLTKKDLILDGQPIGQLKEDLERLEDGVMQGAVPNIEFTTVAKDELRGEEKVRLGKTRAIEVAPVHYTILFRRFFGRAVAALQSRPGFDINSAVGCDVDVHFHQWAQEINAFGDELIDLDFRNFDASLSPFMLFRAYNILGMLSGIDTALVEALVSPIVYSKHRVSSIQYTVEGGMPSGAPATSVVNSLINSTNLWFVIMQVFKCSFSQAMKLFKIITYGDDVLMVWNREQGLLPSESLPLMQQSLTNLGLSATGGDKGAVRVKTLQEISFLSRHFVMDSYGIIHPALKEVSIYSLLAWKRKTANFGDNLNDALWFAYHHGPRFYNTFVIWLSDIFSRKGLVYYMPSYVMLRREYYYKQGMA
nr:putative 3D; RNA-dependent RNA polymerase [tremovirus B1]